MKLRIGHNKTFVAGAVVDSVVRIGQVGEALDQALVQGFAGGQFGGGTLNCQPIFVNLIQLLQGNVADEIPAVGNDAQQVFLLQAHCGFAHLWIIGAE